MVGLPGVECPEWPHRTSEAESRPGKTVSETALLIAGKLRQQRGYPQTGNG
jgi:hypothetical protein